MMMTMNDAKNTKPVAGSPEEPIAGSPEEPIAGSPEEPIAGSPEEATHYHGAVEPIELMQTILTPEEFKGFLKGNAIKYAFRAGRKAGETAEKDRTKFLVYSQWLHKYELYGIID